MLWCSSTWSGYVGTIETGGNCFGGTGSCFKDKCYDSSAIEFFGLSFAVTVGFRYTISFRLILGGSGTTAANRFLFDIRRNVVSRRTFLIIFDIHLKAFLSKTKATIVFAFSFGQSKLCCHFCTTCSSSPVLRPSCALPLRQFYRLSRYRSIVRNETLLRYLQSSDKIRQPTVSSCVFTPMLHELP